MKYYIANLQHRINQEDHRFVFKFVGTNETDFDLLEKIMAEHTKNFSHLNVVGSEVCQIQFETFRALPKFIPDLATAEPIELKVAVQSDQKC